jgi:hypothetical protein
VRAWVRQGCAWFFICTCLPAPPGAPGAGIALANVRERLSLLHDFGASLETWRSEGQFHARVMVPL